MKEKFKILKSAYVGEEGTEYDTETYDEFTTEESALDVLKTLDEDWYYIERFEYQHISDGIYDWFFDEEYGSKSISDFEK